uniref:Uncharacterized protein n=1 Tax=Salix viminalis TaxID=40686 RepID=A0A6N2N0E1_SALVM
MSISLNINKNNNFSIRKKERDKTHLIKKDARYEQSIHYETCLTKSGKLKGSVKGNLQNLAAGETKMYKEKTQHLELERYVCPQLVRRGLVGEFPSQQLAAGVLERRLCVALQHWPGAPSI